MLIEINMVCSAYQAHFKKIAANKQLPTSVVKEYMKEHVVVNKDGSKGYGICTVCEYPVEKKCSTDPPLVFIHKKIVRYESRKMYSRHFVELEKVVNS